MKISKRSWFVIALGFYIIVAASLSFVYLQHDRERDQLNDDLASARSRLSSINTETLTLRQKTLEEDLNKAYAQYEADKEKFVQSIDSVIMGNVLYSMASANSVNITEMRTSDVSKAQLEGASCFVLNIDAKVEGQVADLVAFITQLNADLATAAVKAVNIDIPASGNGQMASAGINLVIYTQEEK